MEKAKEFYIESLRAVAEKNRLPKKSDFSQEDVNRIKGYFDPWPWVLEAAGLKESKQAQRIEKTEKNVSVPRSAEKNSETAAQVNEMVIGILYI